ncbi:MAG: hypothetical protein GXZ14_00945 [Ruminococcaceae bacterium]|nr:hypothetical protein [Oscillospiraceae bacterium]
MVQWVGTGFGLYKIENLPKLDKDSIFTIFDIPHDKESDYNVVIQEIRPTTICVEDADDTEQEIARLPITVNGLNAFKTSEGVTFMRGELTAPIADETIQLCARRDAAGHLYFAAKAGFMLRAVIMPYDCITEEFCTDVENLSALLQIAYDGKQARAVRSVDGAGADVYKDDETEQEEME